VVTDLEGSTRLSQASARHSARVEQPDGSRTGWSVCHSAAMSEPQAAVRSTRLAASQRATRLAVHGDGAAQP
jgi:hypothetical protein